MTVVVFPNVLLCYPKFILKLSCLKKQPLYCAIGSLWIRNFEKIEVGWLESAF